MTQHDICTAFLKTVRKNFVTFLVLMVSIYQLNTPCIRPNRKMQCQYNASPRFLIHHLCLLLSITVAFISLCYFYAVVLASSFVAHLCLHT